MLRVIRSIKGVPLRASLRAPQRVQFSTKSFTGIKSNVMNNIETKYENMVFYCTVGGLTIGTMTGFYKGTKMYINSAYTTGHSLGDDIEEFLLVPTATLGGVVIGTMAGFLIGAFSPILIPASVLTVPIYVYKVRGK